VFQKQDIMRRVVYSLIPMFLFATFLYGWRVIVTTALVFALGIATEYVFEKSRKKKVSEAVLVTCSLYALSLPPATPFVDLGNRHRFRRRHRQGGVRGIRSQRLQSGNHRAPFRVPHFSDRSHHRVDGPGNG
jgi:hypothetical protein